MAAYCTDSTPDRPDQNVSFYDRMAKRYDLFFRDPEQNMQEEGAWIANVLVQHKASGVLDACCGTGRQAVPLAKEGFRVVAADPSGAMLAEARQRAQKAGVTLPVLQTCFATLPKAVSRQFDAVLAMGNGLCNVPAADKISDALRALRACCRDDGICLIGIKDFDSIREGRESFHAHRFVDDGTQRQILFEVWDFHDPLMVCTAIVLESDSTSPGVWVMETHATHEYMLGSQELRRLAIASGFSRVDRLEHPSESVYLLRP